MVAIVQQSPGGLDVVGIDGDGRGIICASTEWIATSVDKVFFVAPRALRVKYIVANVTAAGSDTPTATIRKCASTVAITSGTALHSNSFDLKTTANTNLTGTLSTTSTDLDLVAGDKIAIDFSGALTSAAGVVTVGLAPR